MSTANRFFDVELAVEVKSLFTHYAMLSRLQFLPVALNNQDELGPDQLRDMFILAARSDVVLWSQETWELVASGSEDYADKELPEEIAPDITIQFWILENTFYAVPPAGTTFVKNHPDAAMLGVLVIATSHERERRKLGVFLVFHDPPAPGSSGLPVVYSPGAMRFGDVIPGDHSIFAMVASGLDFMQLPIVGVDKAQIHRQARRAYQRKHGIEHPEVRVVRLRKRQHEVKEPATHRNIDWQCRWFVTSHRRHLKSGKTAWIPGYIKGPEDKPIRAPTMSIFKVVR